MPVLRELADLAARELVIEQALNQIEASFQAARITFAAETEAGIPDMYVLTNGNDLLKLIDDSQLRIKGLSTSIYVDPHKVREMINASLCKCLQSLCHGCLLTCLACSRHHHIEACCNVCSAPGSHRTPSKHGPSSIYDRSAICSFALSQESVIQWDEALGSVRTILEGWLEVQSKWCSLAPMFGPQGLAGQLPLEARRFGEVTREWRKAITTARGHCSLRELLRHAELPNVLVDLARGLEGVHKVG